MMLMPKAFYHGGWLASALFEIGAAILTTVAAAKLVQAGLLVKMYSY